MRKIRENVRRVGKTGTALAVLSSTLAGSAGYHLGAREREEARQRERTTEIRNALEKVSNALDKVIVQKETDAGKIVDAHKQIRELQRILTEGIAHYRPHEEAAQEYGEIYDAILKDGDARVIQEMNSQIRSGKPLTRAQLLQAGVIIGTLNPTATKMIGLAKQNPVDQADAERMREMTTRLLRESGHIRELNRTLPEPLIRRLGIRGK